MTFHNQRFFSDRPNPPKDRKRPQGHGRDHRAVSTWSRARIGFVGLSCISSVEIIGDFGSIEILEAIGSSPEERLGHLAKSKEHRILRDQLDRYPLGAPGERGQV